jgi:hypothetical protein
MNPILQEYQTEIEKMVGTMVRVCTSLHGQRAKLLGLASNAGIPLNTTLNECSFCDNSSVPVHSETIESHLEKLEDGGFDELAIGNMSIAYIYALWEDKYREEFAKSKSLEKNDIKSEVFYELNKYRQAIVHNQSKGTTDTGKLKILPPVARGATVRICRLSFEVIVGKIKQEISNISLPAKNA